MFSSGKVLEVLRRSVWAVFRVEWECIKTGAATGAGAKDWRGRRV